MPKVHLAVPASRQASASSAACWSTMSPVTGTLPPNSRVTPTMSSLATISGRASSLNPKRSRSSPDQSAVSRSKTRERLAVEASVTNAPHRR